MASTLTMQDALNFCLGFISQQELEINYQHPALGIGNIILSTMLGPPFRWRTNRKSVNFAITNGGGTDYAEAISDLGHIEDQWLLDTTANKIHELQGAVALARTTESRRPKQIAPQYDDNLGNVTFRFDAVPDKNYTAYIDYQAKAPLIGDMGTPFAPVTDEFCHVFYTGFLGWAGMLVRDNRFPIWQKDFIAGLLSAQDGLDEQQKALFLGDWMKIVATVQRNQGATQQGVAGRGY